MCMEYEIGRNLAWNQSHVMRINTLIYDTLVVLESSIVCIKILINVVKINVLQKRVRLKNFSLRHL